jgi:tetratricopeptide (TPR) repeat protein
MSGKRDSKPSRTNGPVSSPAPPPAACAESLTKPLAGAAPATAKPQRRSRARLWCFRIAALVLAPLAALGLLELILQIAGFGYPTRFFINGAELERPGVLIDNRNFGRWVFPRGLEPLPAATPFALPKEKPAGACRIFVLGESAALGFPDPSTSFARALEVLLRHSYPNARFEIVNTAMVAINSHVALPIARECLHQKPDLLIVHLGNNEVIGPFGAAGVLGSYSPSRGFIQANLALKATRTGQLYDRIIHGLATAGQAPKIWTGLSMFTNCQMRADDARLGAIYAHHEANLRDICQAAIQASVPVILCTIPVNLRDCAPFGSLHQPQLDASKLASWEQHFQAGKQLEAQRQFAQAIEAYRQAQSIDSTYAELAFRLARCYRALGDHAQALRCFEQARDLDVLRFRTDSKLNQTIQAVAAAYGRQNVRLADAERAFAEASPGQAPGEELFLEHVHMTFAGNYLLARTVYEALRAMPLPALGRPVETSPGVLPEDECARRLGHTLWNEMKAKRIIYDLLVKGPPFTLQFDHAERSAGMAERLTAIRKELQEGGIKTALQIQDQAARQNGGDWMLRMKFGDLLAETGNTQEARKQYEASLANLRHNLGAHYMLGQIDLGMNRWQGAEDHFRTALRIDANNLEARAGLARALESQGRDAEALAEYRELAARSAHRAFGPDTLGQYLLRTGKPEEAKALFQQALQLEPTSAVSRMNLALVALREGQLDQAAEHLEAALRIQPDWPEARQRLAEVNEKRRARNPRQ